MDLADKIREIAKRKHIDPALRSGRGEFSIAVRDLIDEAAAEGISTAQRTPPFCTSIQTRGFLRESGIEIVRVDGPASKRSTTVVVHYRVAKHKRNLQVPSSAVETPTERAFRLTEKLRGLMKNEIAAHGGAEGYMRWVRSDDENAA